MFTESAESDQVQRRATSTPINEERDVFDSMTSFRGFDSSKENSLPPFSVGFAGATPHPATKKRSSILNTDLSNVLKKKDVEDFLRSLEKESCLCGTVHVKMAAAVITVIDLLIIFFLDQHVYQTRFDSYKYAMPIVLASYGCILLAQCGLRYKKCWMMVPMLVIHISVLLLCILGAARDILTIITSASDIAINRRVMVGFYEGCAVLINLYVVFILFRAFFNLRSSKTLLPLTIVNSIFNGQHPGLFDGQEEVLFEKPKMGTPSTPKNRTVRFVEPKNETFSLS